MLATLSTVAALAGVWERGRTSNSNKEGHYRKIPREDFNAERTLLHPHTTHRGPKSSLSTSTYVRLVADLLQDYKPKTHVLWEQSASIITVIPLI